MQFPTKPKITKKSGGILISLAIVAIGFALYFFVYVDHNRSRDTARAYRVLNQIGKTVEVIYGDILSNSLVMGGAILKEHPITNSPTYDFSSIARRDVFDEFIVAFNDKVTKGIKYQSFMGTIHLDSIKTISGSSLLSSGDSYQTLKINGDNYRVFTQSLDFGREEWILVGCINNKKFIRQNRKINTWIVLNSGLAVILVLLSMPILKLIFMSQVERLRLYNIFWTGFSIVVGTPLIMLSLLIAFNFLLNDRTTVDKRLNRLAHAISQNFMQEVTSMYDQLSAADSQLDTLELKRVVDFGRSSINILDKPGWTFDDYNEFNEILWIDSAGFQTFHVTPFKTPSSLPNLKKREYYQQIINDHTWKLPSREKEEFGFQSIRSKITGKTEIAVSKASANQDAKVAAITSKMSSVIDALLPFGYGFSIIDQAGDVLIHLDGSTSLQENFILETENNSAVESALFSYRSLYTSFNYHGKERRAFIQPISDFPLFVVTYFDMSVLKDKITGIWTVALFILMLSLLLSGTLVLIMALTQLRKRKVRYRQFVFDWMTPSRSRYKTYKKITLVNVILSSLPFIFYSSWKYLELELIIGVILILPSIIFGLIYFYIYRDNKEHTKAISRFLLAAIILFVIYDIIYVFNDFKGEGYLLGIQALIVTVYFLEFSWGVFTRFWALFNPVLEWVSQKVDAMLRALKLQRLHFYEAMKTTNVKAAYTRMLLTWLLITSFLPMILIYNLSYEQESALWSKHNLLDVSYRMDLKAKDVQDEYHQSLVPSSKSKEFLKLKRQNGNYFDFMIDRDSVERTDFNEKTTSALYDSIVFYGRPVLNHYNALNRALIFDQSHNNLYHWKYYEEGDQEKLAISYKTNYYPDNERIMLNKGIESIYNVTQNKLSLFLFILLFPALIVFCLYRLISFCLEKIYSLDDDASLHEKSALTPDDFRELAMKSNVILIGVPGSGKSRMLQKAFKDTKIVDCLLINDKVTWDAELKDIQGGNYSRVVVENFEYGIRDHMTNELKRDLLELLINQRTLIIIVTEIHPLEIVRNYEKSQGTASEQEVSLKNTDSWRHILSGFVDVYQPLPTLEETKDERTHLSVIEEVVDKLLAEDATEEDKIVIRQIHAQSYYYAIWNTLTKEERFVVFDLSDDNFINVKNKDILYNLVRKGLVTYDGRWKLFNPSFANFVLTNVDEKEAKAMEREESLKGDWINIRNPIIIIMVSLIILISFGDPDFFANINSIVIAITGIASLIPALSGIASLTQKIKPAD